MLKNITMILLPVSFSLLISGKSAVSQEPTRKEQSETGIPADVQKILAYTFEARRRQKQLYESYKRQLSSDKEKLAFDAAMRKLDEMFFAPPLVLKDTSVGKTGSIGHYEVMQVIGKDKLLIKDPTDKLSKQPAILTGTSTEGLIARKVYESPRSTIYKVTGTTTHKNAAGGTDTVFVIEPFDTAPLRKYEPLYRKLTGDEEPDSRSPRKPETTFKSDEAAASKLKLAKSLLDNGKTAAAKRRLRAIVKQYPGTEEASEATALLKSSN